jgi:CheY-like chemotaxis protein
MDMAKGTVLIADSNRVVRIVVGRMLEHRGYVVRLAEDGRQALQMIRFELPDLLVIDSYMPSLSGMQLLFEITDGPNLNKLPIIMISNNATDIRSVVLRMGAKECLPKPLHVDELLRTMEQYIQTGEEHGQGKGPDRRR